MTLPYSPTVSVGATRLGSILASVDNPMCDAPLIDNVFTVTSAQVPSATNKLAQGVFGAILNQSIGFEQYIWKQLDLRGAGTLV